MRPNKLAEFQWNAQRETLEQSIRGQQRDTLMFWMLQHHDGPLSIQTMQHIHDLTAPIEWANKPNAKYLAGDCIDAATYLRRGSNAAICHCLSELVDMCRRYIDHINARPVAL